MERAFRAFLSARNILPVQRERSVGPMGQLQGRSGTKATFNWYLTRGRFTTKGFNEPGRLSGSLYRHRILNSECNERARDFSTKGIAGCQFIRPKARNRVGIGILGTRREFWTSLSWKFWRNYGMGSNYTLMFREFSLDIGWKLVLIVWIASVLS